MGHIIAFCLNPTRHVMLIKPGQRVFCYCGGSRRVLRVEAHVLPILEIWFGN
jgi:hypothetical protein